MNAISPKFCTHCGEPLRPGVTFCESCGHPVEPSETKPASPVSAGQLSPEPNGTGEVQAIGTAGGGRGRRVLLALGIVAGVAVVLGLWIAGTWEAPQPREPDTLPSSEEMFPVKPKGVDSINNTVDGRKVVIEGDGQVMNSPGLGVNRPVWCLNGPTHSRFSVPVAKQEGRGTFTPNLQVLVPELATLSGGAEALPIRIRLVGNDGSETVSEHRLTPANRWQPLAISFPYDGSKAPYRLHFEASGFTGAIYIDRGTRALTEDPQPQP